MRAAWKAATKAVTKAAPAPDKRRRRRGDGRAEFYKAAQRVLRVRPAQICDPAAFDMLEWLNIWQGNGPLDYEPDRLPSVHLRP